MHIHFVPCILWPKLSVESGWGEVVMLFREELRTKCRHIHEKYYMKLVLKKYGNVLQT